MELIVGGRSVMDTSIRVGFSTPRRFNPISWIVRKFTGSRCSHAWFLFWNSRLKMEVVMEAHELGFRLIPYDRFKKENIVVAVLKTKHPIDEGLIRVAQRYLGTGYDFGGLIGMAIVKIGQWLKVKWGNPFRSPKHVFCSEAVYRAMQWSPGYENLKADADSEDPELLMKQLEAGEV